YNTLRHLAEYDDLDLHVVTCEKWHTRRAQGDGVAEQDGWTVHYLPSPPRLPHSLTMLTLDRLAVRRRIVSLAPDVVHAHGQAAAYPFAAFDTGRPTLVTVHGINMLEAQVDPRGGALIGKVRVALWAMAEKQCLRRASNIAVISPFVAQAISPYTRAQLHPVENPVHDDLFLIEPAPEAGKVLLVGSIQKRKGILEAIDAMALVREQVPGARLYIAGGLSPAYAGYGHDVLHRLAETEAKEYVHLLGNLAHPALLEAYRTSQLFLFPSHLEASSVAVAEALAAGLPCVVSDIGGTAHLVTEGVSGHLVPPGDIGAFARRVVELLRHPERARTMGQHGRAFARDHASARVAAKKTHDLYFALVQARAPEIGIPV
ncbi:MAG: glycosyltransferase family 4 protein, partial [Anaerolineae bacterium]